MNTLRLLFFFSLLLGCNKRESDTIHVAVASNFINTAKKLITIFEKETSHKIILSSGSTGKIYTQIAHNAPYDVFLSADKWRVEKLEKMGMGLKGTRFTYAWGKLVLWSQKNQNVEKSLKEKAFSNLVLAAPEVAPYGIAGKEVLEKLKLWQDIQSKLVFAENVAQAYAFSYVGGAELSFISYAQVKRSKGFYWLIPQNLHKPIEQQAIQLKKGKGADFLLFLKSKKARSLIEKEGYGVKDG